MKVNCYKLVLQVLDFEGNNPSDVISSIENSRYSVITVEAHKKEIENWEDNHPLNQRGHQQYFFDFMKDAERIQ